MCQVTHAQRENQLLATGWRFSKGDVGLNAKVEKWEKITVPHTWNVVDGSNGLAANPDLAEGYYRGPCWYFRPLSLPKNWRTKRVFIRFEAASLISDVFVNDVHIGQHRGGFAAFCYEIGNFLKFDGKDTLKVRVDNARTFDVAPLSGDFTVFGGLYRPVHVFATSETCISPLEFASAGVYFTYTGLDGATGKVDVRIVLSNLSSQPVARDIQIEIQDHEKHVVSISTKSITVTPGQSNYLASFTIPKARLWDGKRDPYLYSARICLLQSGKVQDEVTQTLGLRKASFDNHMGFLLNDQPYSLYGVSRHQEKRGKGWALSDQDQKEDHAMIVEMGANSIRLAHYQQAEIFHDLSDQAGIVTWQEIPLVDCVSGSPEFLANARQQLTEMIFQNWNHPSICFFGLFNEMEASWAAVPSAPALPVIGNLSDLARELDSSRIIVGASKPQNPNQLHRVPEAMGWNLYPGWYTASAEDAASQIANYSRRMNFSRISLSEYGAGANPFQFAGSKLIKPRGNEFHPQEWQNYVHETIWRQCRDNPHLWSTYAWAMFDFAVDKRNEGGNPGINNKGLVTQDRKIRKDSYFFYKANWNPQPMIYLTSKHAIQRTEEITEIKGYSNCDEVELKVNGVSMGKEKPDDFKIVKWPEISLRKGTNFIELIGSSSGKFVKDQAVWQFKLD